MHYVQEYEVIDTNIFPTLSGNTISGRCFFVTFFENALSEKDLCLLGENLAVAVSGA